MHADDLLYTWRGDQFFNRTLINTDSDRRFLRNWQKLLSNFVKYGNPTPFQTDNMPVWKEAQDSRAACVYMNIDTELEERHRMFPLRMEFWHRMVFRDALEKYAVSEEEEELLVEIDSAIAEVEDDDDDNDDDDDDDDDDDHDDHDDDDDDKVSNKRRGGWKRKNKKGSKGWRNQNKGWRRNIKQKMMNKRRRLARKLKGIKCHRR